MNIAYCSPFNPIKSGISDFSEELIMELKKYANIDLFYNVKTSKNEILSNFTFYNIKELYNENIRNNYDIIVYHMGNNVDYHKCINDAFLDFSGILELHDFSLHNYLAGDTYVKNDIENYIKIVKYSHGDEGVKIVQNFLDGNAGAPWETHALQLTVNKHLIDRAQGVIVHSDMALQMVKGIKPDVPVVNIPLHTLDIQDNYEELKLQAKKRLKIHENTIVFGSFGYATRAKRIMETLDALGQYYNKNTKDFHYFIVGKIDGIDVKGKIKELSLENNVTITGYTDLDQFKTYMSACDICLNLRYPTHGESSASLHRMLGLGKPIIVSNVGTFEEYPDDIVLKVRYDDNEVLDIYNAIVKLTKDKDMMNTRSKQAYQYALNNCDLQSNALKYINFFISICNNCFNKDDTDNFIDKLFEINLIEDDYIEHLVKDKDIGIMLRKPISTTI